MTLGVCNLFTMGSDEATTKLLITSWLDWFLWVFVHQKRSHSTEGRKDGDFPASHISLPEVN